MYVRGYLQGSENDRVVTIEVNRKIDLIRTTKMSASGIGKYLFDLIYLSLYLIT